MRKVFESYFKFDFLGSYNNKNKNFLAFNFNFLFYRTLKPMIFECKSIEYD